MSGRERLARTLARLQAAREHHYRAAQDAGLDVDTDRPDRVRQAAHDALRVQDLDDAIRTTAARLAQEQEGQERR